MRNSYVNANPVRHPDIIARIKVLVAADPKQAGNVALVDLIKAEFGVEVTPGQVAGAINREHISRGGPTKDRIVLERGTYPSRIMAALQGAAIDGVARIGRDELMRVTGISENPISRHLRHMAKLGAVEIIRGSGPIPNQFRVLRPDLLTEQTVWTMERVAMMRERYCSTWNRDLVRAINALPGQLLSMGAIKDWANAHGLLKEAAFLATRKPPIPSLRKIRASPKILPVKALPPTWVRVETPPPKPEPTGPRWLSWPDIKQIALADGKLLTDMNDLATYNRGREARGRHPLYLTTPQPKRLLSEMGMLR